MSLFDQPIDEPNAISNPLPCLAGRRRRIASSVEDERSVVPQHPPRITSAAALFDEPVDESGSPPIRPAGLRRTPFSRPPPRQTSGSHTLSVENVAGGGHLQTEIDEASPSEDERIAEAALRGQDDVSQSQGQFYLLFV